MGRIKGSLTREVERAESAPHIPTAISALPGATTTAAAPVPAAPATRSDSVTVTLEPNQGREIKLSMRDGARATFSWSTDKDVVNFDEHADSEIPRRDYHGYRKGSAVASNEGVLVAAFHGWHGWFWRNRGTETLTVTLRTSGDYQDIKEPK